MKLEITRALGLVAALSSVSLAMVAWSEPTPAVVSAYHSSSAYCPTPPHARQTAAAQPDQDLLLLLFGLSQGMGRQS